MPKPYSPHRFTPFLEKPRSWRRDRFVSLRWKIANDPNGRGVFTSQHMMDGGIYNGQRYERGVDSHWCDFRFLSRAHAQHGLVYTATVSTALMKAVDWAEEYAWNQERAALNEDEFALAHPAIEFVPCGKGLYTMKSGVDPVFERFGGVSAWGLRARFLREAIDRIPPVAPSCQLKRHYKTGLGAWFITANPSITIDNVAEMIEQFWARGEVPYEDEAIDFSQGSSNHDALARMINDQACAWERMDMRARGIDAEEIGNDGATHDQEKPARGLA